MFFSKKEEEWEKWLQCYPKVMRLYAAKKKKEKLIKLDDWYQKALKLEVDKRKPLYLKKDELKKLMERKLTRGKFHPRLTELIKSITEKDIKEITNKSYGHIKEPEVAIKELRKVKGVGPAPASAIMTYFCPEKYAVMADESVQSLLSGKIDYTLKYYLLHLEKIHLRKELSRGESLWTAHDVELALSSWKIATQNGFQLADYSEIKRKKGNKENEENVLKK